METYESAEAWYAGQTTWKAECLLLREVVLGFGLTETLKWKHPCYMDNGRNVNLVSWRNGGAVVSLLKGALVDDPRGRLLRAGQNRYDRYLLYGSVAEIEAERSYLEDLLTQNIQAEREGRTLPPLPDEIDLVPELHDALQADPELRAAFEALTPGRKRGWNLHFGKAKRSATRASRIEKAREKIFAGKGLMDCVCGRSKRMPRCDGSHRKP